jgi:hypothetical protein
MLLGMGAQRRHARHDLVLHDAVFQSKIVGFDEVTQSLDNVSECGRPAVAHSRLFGGFFLGNKRSDESR